MYSRKNKGRGSYVEENQSPQRTARSSCGKTQWTGEEVTASESLYIGRIQMQRIFYAILNYSD